MLLAALLQLRESSTVSNPFLPISSAIAADVVDAVAFEELQALVGGGTALAAELHQSALARGRLGRRRNRSERRDARGAKGSNKFSTIHRLAPLD